MPDFVHQRHKPPISLQCPRQLVVACPPMHSQVNLSRIIRAMGCFGAKQLLAAGYGRWDSKITRGAEQSMDIRRVRSLAPEIKKLRQAGFRLVGLEQTSDSQCLFEYRFERRTALIVGSERHGIKDEILSMLDVAVEIPVYGEPHSFNAATATAMALYEYCRQFPTG